MAEDLIPILTRFHREVVLPDVQRVVGELRLEMNQRFAGLDSHFDAIYQRFDRLETEYHIAAEKGGRLRQASGLVKRRPAKRPKSVSVE